MKKLKMKLVGGIAMMLAASSAFAYPVWNGSTSYRPYAVVEYQGRVYQHCGDCYSRGDVPVPNQKWTWGNSWNDLGYVGRNAAPVGSTSSVTASSWVFGKSYAVGSVVSYNGVRYSNIQAVVGGTIQSSLSPDRASTYWKRM